MHGRGEKASIIVAGKQDGKRTHERPVCTWDNNMMTDMNVLSTNKNDYYLLSIVTVNLHLQG
jgi:hypothetical protein